MSFSQEMKDFLGAYQAGTKINSENASADQARATTDATVKKTARDNDPDQLELQDQTARARLDQIKAATAHSGVASAYTSALTKRLQQTPINQDQGSGLFPSAMGGNGGNAGGGAPVTGAAPALPPAANTAGYGSTDNYADGGVIPDATRAAGTDKLRKRMGDKNAQWLGQQQSANTEDDLAADRNGTPRSQGRRIMNDFASGGVIPDGPDQEDDSDEDDASSIPTTGTNGQPLEMRGGRGGSRFLVDNGIVDPQAIHDAARDGASYGVHALGLQNGVRTPRQRMAAQRLAQGAGALTPQEMDAARNAVDPKHQLPEGQRNSVALGAVYQYWVNHGEPEKAQKVAFQMLQNYRLNAQNYANMAAKAAQQGNLDAATKLAIHAYANVPDGREAQLSVNPDGRILYHFTDENGKTVTKGLATPQELASSAMGLASHGFDQAILSAAGQREADSAGTGKATKGGTSAGNGPKFNPKNTDQNQQNVSSAMDKQMEDYQKTTGKAFDPQDAQSIKDAAAHILQQNPSLMPNEAIEAAASMGGKGKDPSATFSTGPADENGNHQIKLSNGRTINMSEDQLNVMAQNRASQIKAQQATEKQQADDAAVSKARWDKAKGAASTAAGYVSDEAKKFGAELMGDADKIGAAIPAPVASRARAVASGVGEDIGDAAQKYGPAVGQYAGTIARAAANPTQALTDAIGFGVKSAMQALQRGSQQGGSQPQQASGAIPSSPDQGDTSQFLGP